MNTEQKKEAINNALRSFEINKKYFAVAADGRVKNKFSIAKIVNNAGGLCNVLPYMTYEELNQYLKGWYDSKMKKPILN